MLSDIRVRPVARAGTIGGVAARVLTWGVVGFATFILLSTLFFTALSHIPIPQADEWYNFAVYDRILREGHVWQGLFQPHNEHRIVFPRLVLFSDYLVFGGRGLLDKAAILVTQALEAGLFLWLIARSEAGATARRALGAVAVVLLFSLYQSENFVWGFQVQFVGVFACASLSCTLFALGLAADRGGRARALMAAAVLLAAVATFTMANGLTTGLVLVVLAGVARARPAVVLVTAAAAAGVILAFDIGYSFDDGHQGAADMMRHLAPALAFTAGYLGNVAPFGVPGQVAFGACGLAALAGIAGVMAARGERDPVRLALLGIALFAAGSAAITALGRAVFGLDGIAASRYSTGAATFWAAILVNAWSLSRRPALGIACRGAVCLAALVLLQACWAGQIPMGRQMEKRATDYGAMEDAMLLGYYDVPALDAFEEPVDEARAMAPALRRLGLSIFAGRDASLLDHPLSEIEVPGASPLACAGSFAAASVTPALGPEGTAVSGTSGLRLRFGRPGRIYIVDGGRRIVGFARTGFGDGAWQGYARAGAGTALSAYAISEAGRTCLLGTASAS